MKKLLSCVLAELLVFQATPSIALAVESGQIKVASTSVLPGEIFDLPIELEKNPGVIALSINLTYDADELELIGVEDGKILGESTFYYSNNMAKLPYNMNWDDTSVENNTGTGTLATLSFRAKANASGDTEVSVSVNPQSTFDTNFIEVPFTTATGIISIENSGAIITTDQITTTSTTETTPIIPEGASIIVDKLKAHQGGTVTVPIRIQNNPGLAALSLNLIYDKSQLNLLSVEDGKILGASTFITSEDLTRIPYILSWDDNLLVDNTENGILANLEFAVLAESGKADVTIIVNQKSTINAKLEEVVFSVVNGAVRIENPQTTAQTTITSTSSDHTTTTRSTTFTTKTTTTTTVSTTTAQIPDVLLGDVDCNGEFTISDAVLLCRIAAEYVDDDVKLTEQNFIAADFDQDKLITILDVTKLLKHLSQLPNEQ